MEKVQITVTRIYPKGVKGHSKSMTVKDVTLKEAFNRIKELFEND